MNKEEILQLQPGYDLDKLIAEQVMGWKLVDNQGAVGGKYWIGDGVQFGDMRENDLPEFSEIRMPAFQATEKFPSFRLTKSFGLSGTIWIFKVGDYTEVFNSFLPLAICHGLLMAVYRIS